MFKLIQFIRENSFAFANLLFAGLNALSSFFIVSIFGINLYGIFVLYNNVDNFVDYAGSHLRSTFESSIPGAQNEREVIESFALLQILLGFVSLLIFFVLSHLSDEDLVNVAVCQIFMLLSPAKSYLAFFRSVSRVTGLLLAYSVVVITVSLLNVIVLIIAYFDLNFLDYLSMRAIILIAGVFILFYYHGFLTKKWMGSIRFGLIQLYKRSVNLILYSLGNLIYLVWDKFVIAFFFNIAQLGLYSLAFIFYNFIQILITSFMSKDFKNLMNSNVEIFNYSLTYSVKSVLHFLIFVEFIMFPVVNTLYFANYHESVLYLLWLIPTTVPLVYIELGYLYMIRINSLNRINKLFIFSSVLYVGIGLVLSLIFSSILWFSILLFFHHLVLVFILMRKDIFLENLFSNVFGATKASMFAFAIVHLFFTIYYINF